MHLITPLLIQLDLFKIQTISIIVFLQVYGKNDKEKEKKSKRAQWASEFGDRMEAMATMGKPMPGVVGIPYLALYIFLFSPSISPPPSPDSILVQGPASSTRRRSPGTRAPHSSSSPSRRTSSPKPAPSQPAPPPAPVRVLGTRPRRARSARAS